MSLAAALDSAMAQVPGCVFAGFVELESGLMLAARPAGALTELEADNLAALAVVLYKAEPMRRLGDAIAGKAGGAASSGESRFGEALAISGARLHLFLRLPGQAGQVACFVSDHREDPAKVLDAARAGLATLAKAKLAP